LSDENPSHRNLEDSAMGITTSTQISNEIAASESVEERIRGFILQQFPAARSRDIGTADSLLTQGIIDSLGVLEVVTFLEKEFRLTISEDELLSDHFESIAQIARLISQKLAREDASWIS
jgi:acyl carrier protein